MTDHKIIERIKKLLALAGSSNEHEAANAAEKAQMLLAEYNLTMADVSPGSREERYAIQRVISESTPWMRVIAAPVGRLYTCFHMFEFERVPAPGRKRPYIRKDVHTFIGPAHNVAVASMMFGYLVTTVERLANEAARGVPASRRSSYLTSFKSGCAIRLNHRLTERIRKAEAGELKTESGNTLPALLDQYQKVMQDVMGIVGADNIEHHKASANSNDPEGLVDGFTAGGDVGLDQQVEDNRQRRLSST